jgi:hypothetical protein
MDEISLIEMPVKLPRSCRSFNGAVQAFWGAWQNPERRLALAAMIGDWPVVVELAQQQGRSELAAQAAVSAERCQRQWLTIVRYGADSYAYPDALRALAHAKAEELSDYLKEGFVDPELHSAVLEIVQDDRNWVPIVREHFRRTVAHHGEDFDKAGMARYLAKHGHPLDELFEGLLCEPAAHDSA